MALQKIYEAPPSQQVQYISAAGVPRSIRADYDGDGTEDLVIIYWNDVEDRVEVHYGAPENGEDGVTRDTSIKPNIETPLTVDGRGNYSFCLTGDLHYFEAQTQWPYFQKRIKTNSPSCSETNCDLEIITPIEITRESSEGAGDGEITVTATSSNSGIEFSLDNETWQSSGTFTGLSAGTYTLYARDDQGCTDQIDFQLKVALGFGEKYRMTYDDDRLNETIAKIFQDGFSGSVEEVKGGGRPFELSYDKKQRSKYRVIKPSTAVIELVSDTNYKFTELFTANPYEFRVDIEKYGSLYWRGFVIPGEYREPYTDTPYIVQITATDGLADFEQLDFATDAEERIRGRKSYLDIIAICLDRVENRLNIREDVNITETSFSGDDLLRDLHYDAFYLFDFDENEPMSCSRALTELLKVLECRIFQQEGKWIVQRIQALEGSYDYVEYNSSNYDGALADSGTINPKKDITGARVSKPLVFLNQQQLLEMNEAWRYVRIRHNFRTEDQIIQGGDLENIELEENEAGNKVFPLELQNWKNDVWGPFEEGEGFQIVDINSARLETPHSFIGLSYSSTLRVEIGYEMTVSQDEGSQATEPTLPLKIVYGDYTRDNTPEWTLADSTYDARILTTRDAVDFFINNMPKYVNGNDFYIVINNPNQGDYSIEEFTIRFVKVHFRPENLKAEIRENYDIDNPNQAVFRPDRIHTIAGDVPNVENAINIYKHALFDGSDNLTQYWTGKGEGDAKPLLQILMEDLYVNYRVPWQKITGVLFGEFEFGQAFEDAQNSGKRFILLSMKRDDKMLHTQVELAELKTDDFDFIDENILLQEDGTAILQEDGSTIRLENA